MTTDRSRTDHPLAVGGEGVPTRWNLDAVVAALRLSREVTHNIRPRGRICQPPSREALIRILDSLSAVLFPTHYGQSELGREHIDYFVGSTLNGALVLLVEQVQRSLSFADSERSLDEAHAHALSITRDLAADLPAIRGLLVGDLRAAFQGDPAATSMPEILLGYPGMTAILYHRLAHSLYQRAATLLARLISDLAHSKTGIDIHPAATIGGNVSLTESVPPGSHVTQARLLSARRADPAG